MELDSLSYFNRPELVAEPGQKSAKRLQPSIKTKTESVATAYYLHEKMKLRVLLALLVISICQISADWKQGLTTKGIDDYFVNRCVEFGKLPRTKEIFDVKKFTKSHCETLWNQFAENIKGRDPCKITKVDYGDWLRKVDQLYLDQSWGYFKDKVRVF